MINITKKQKIIVYLLVLAVGFSFLVISLQKNITQVSAQVVPVTVNINHLGFGTVFPGEELTGTFSVSYAEEGEGVNYRIIQKRKPLPPEHSEYPDGGDPEMPGFYNNLCPHLEKVSLEGEGDTEGQDGNAFVGPEDITDVWTIYFKVPAIFGHVAQEHMGGIISESGEYGCDISVDVLISPSSICGMKFFDVNQDREMWGDDYVLPDWTINLLEFTDCTSGEGCDNGWEVIASEITDNNGNYCFDLLEAGTYRVKEVLQPGWFPTIPTNPDYHQATINEGQTLNYIDFGNYIER